MNGDIWTFWNPWMFYSFWIFCFPGYLDLFECVWICFGILGTWVLNFALGRQCRNVIFYFLVGFADNWAPGVPNSDSQRTAAQYMHLFNQIASGGRVVRILQFRWHVAGVFVFGFGVVDGCFHLEVSVTCVFAFSVVFFSWVGFVFAFYFFWRWLMHFHVLGFFLLNIDFLDLCMFYFRFLLLVFL